MARGAVTRRPPISLYMMVLRTEGFAYDVGVWDLSIVQGPFSATPPNLRVFATNFCIAVCVCMLTALLLFCAGVLLHEPAACAASGHARHGRAPGVWLLPTHPAAVCVLLCVCVCVAASHSPRRRGVLCVCVCVCVWLLPTHPAAGHQLHCTVSDTNNNW
jgi:hypothetical protein